MNKAYDEHHAAPAPPPAADSLASVGARPAEPTSTAHTDFSPNPYAQHQRTDGVDKQQVYVLRDGFAGWQALHRVRLSSSFSPSSMNKARPMRSSADDQVLASRRTTRHSSRTLMRPSGAERGAVEAVSPAREPGIRRFSSSSVRMWKAGYRGWYRDLEACTRAERFHSVRATCRGRQSRLAAGPAHPAVDLSPRSAGASTGTCAPRRRRAPLAPFLRPPGSTVAHAGCDASSEGAGTGCGCHFAPRSPGSSFRFSALLPLKLLCTILHDSPSTFTLETASRVGQ